jgi:Type IV secretion system pilin
MNKIKILVSSLIMVVGMMLPATLVLAQAPTPSTPAAATGTPTGGAAAICEGVAIAGGKCGEGDKQITDIIKFAIRMFQTIIGVIAIFTIATAGLNYVLSAGDSGKTATAKNRILYSAIGLAIVALAEVIVQFILNRVTANT